jgi:hypothetical protein
MKKIMISFVLLCCIAAILLTLLLVQNPVKEQSPFSVSTPKKTAVRHVMKMTEAGFHVDTNTVEAIQKVVMNNLTLVLVQYSGHPIEGDAEQCEMIIETKESLLHHWKAENGAGLCHKMNDPSNTIPITIASNYGTYTLLNCGYSAAYGYLRDQQITKVLITWEDGQKQQAGVRGSTYLAAREGDFYIEKIETFNSSGASVYSSRLGSDQEAGNQ